MPASDLSLRDSTESDLASILRLNRESEHFLSPLTMDQLRSLHAQARHHRVVMVGEALQGFLLAFREGASYDSPNYRWFAERRDRFLYIDRVVIDAAARGRSLGRRLYEDLFDRAREQAVTLITCEFDIDPPNEGSRRFHEKLGFQEVGTQRVAGGKKAVSLQELRL
jgi:predicted GNAT superfamily acetyltransferase